VAAAGTLTVNATSMTAALTFSGAAEADGSFVINAGSGADNLTGGAGNDVISTGAGANTVVGGAGADSITGGSSTDTIDGGSGNDTINGAAGIDVITGGTGADNLTGGSGNDVFTYDAAAESTLSNLDVITDWATGDTINLTYNNGGGAAAAVGSVATVQDFSAQASLGAALNAAANSNTVDRGIVVFIYGGNTYIMLETTGATTTYASTDLLIQLTGTPFTTSTSIAGLGIDGI
jgi:Ca2+-binding RTX toxin-like protein